jgi:DNA-3-methyladenine glycosylase II
MPVERLTLALPQSYRGADVLAFHGRDAEGVAEQLSGQQIRKGVLLDGVAVLLELSLMPGAAACTIDADRALAPAAREHAHEALLNLLGLRIDPAPFVAFAREDLLFGPLVQRQPELRIVQSATVFEALSWAIIGQQINLAFAIALRRTLILQAGRRHSSGLWCYPEAPDVARLDIETLTSRKFSRAKAETLLRLAQLVSAGELSLAPGGDPAAIAQQLLAVKGIGPWTVNYTLLRGYGDVAIRTALQRLRGADSKPGIAETEAWLTRYSPHRTMAGAHLWASLDGAANSQTATYGSSPRSIDQ